MPSNRAAAGAALPLTLALFFPRATAAQGESQDQNSNAQIWDQDSTHKAVVDKSRGIYVDGATAKKVNGGGARLEEQAEILRTMFEGQSADIHQIITRQFPGSKAPSAESLDRLSLSHLTGYSPQIASLQSRLNAQASGIPGIARLAETGKLDYATLRYPRYVLYYDLQKMQIRLSEAAARKMPIPAQDLKKRGYALAAAKSAIADFDSAALAAQNPRRITVALLKSLDSKQKNASRWIMDAALLEENDRAKMESSLLSPALYSLILGAPENISERQAYIRRGQAYISALKMIRQDDAAASRMLESASWPSSLNHVRQIAGQSGALSRRLYGDLPDYLKTPYLLDSISRKNASVGFIERTRAWLFPSSPGARQLSKRTAALVQLKSAFEDIADGNSEAARAILSQFN
ncbi:MAG: hypothetical protein ACYCPQ_07030 [Elusimicrobiota bacterium]